MTTEQYDEANKIKRSIGEYEKLLSKLRYEEYWLTIIDKRKNVPAEESDTYREFTRLDEHKYILIDWIENKLQELDKQFNEL